MFKCYQEEVVKLRKSGKTIEDALKTAYDNEKVKVDNPKINALQHRYFVPVALRTIVGGWQVDYLISVILDPAASLGKKQYLECAYALKIDRSIREDLDAMLSKRAGTKVEAKSFLFDF